MLLSAWSALLYVRVCVAAPHASFTPLNIPARPLTSLLEASAPPWPPLPREEDRIVRGGSQPETPVAARGSGDADDVAEAGRLTFNTKKADVPFELSPRLGRPAPPRGQREMSRRV